MGYNYYSYQPSIMAGGNIAAIIMLLALAGAILVNFLFLSKKNEKKFDGFLGWLYDVLSFKKLMVEHLLRILCMYFILLVFGFGIVFMFQVNPLIVLLVMVLLIVAIRLMYEFLMVNIIICKNTSEINQKINPSKNDADKKAPKICQSCGKPLNPSDHFCPYCGSDL